MIVVDPRAFRRLWPALGVWLFLFLTAGDGAAILRREAALRFGRPAQATIVAKRRRRSPVLTSIRRNVVYFAPLGAKTLDQEAVGPLWHALSRGRRVAVHVLGTRAFLDDDLGYSRWKLSVFGAAFAALWLWAAARYRFG